MSKKNLEMKGIEPLTFRMQSERSTTELHPRLAKARLIPYICMRLSPLASVHLHAAFSPNPRVNTFYRMALRRSKFLLRRLRCFDNFERLLGLGCGAKGGKIL